MPRTLTIVGLGEALLRETPARSAPAGLACTVALRAAQLGHRGVVVSRIGQDRAGTELQELLRTAGVEVGHLQSDPDLPTGRVIERPTGEVVARYDETRAAFDNLQWDYDLEDIAHEADAVVYSLLTRRSGQTRSEENRFLAACDGAMRVFDLTSDDDGAPDRRLVQSGLEYADIVVVDRDALSAVMPGTNGEAMDIVVSTMFKHTKAKMIVGVAPDPAGARWTLHRQGEHWSATAPAATPPSRSEAGAAAIVSILHGVLSGAEPDQAMQFAVKVAEHVVNDRDAPISVELFGGTR